MRVTVKDGVKVRVGVRVRAGRYREVLQAHDGDGLLLIGVAKEKVPTYRVCVCGGGRQKMDIV